MKKFFVLFLLMSAVLSLSFAAPQLGVNIGYGGRGFNFGANDTKLNVSSGGFKLSANCYFPFNPDDNYSTVTGGIDVELDSLFAINLKENWKYSGESGNKTSSYKNLIGVAVVPNLYLAATAMGQAAINDIFQFNFGGGLVGGYSSYRLKTIESKYSEEYPYTFNKDAGFAWGLRFRLGFVFNVSKTVGINLLGTFDNYFYDGNVGWEFGSNNRFGKSIFIYDLDVKAGVTIKF